MNAVQLTGRITRDIELRKTNDGKSYTRFNLAVNRPKKQNGEQEADFISCIAWEKKAELMGQYLEKGSKILIQGHIHTRNYDKPNGERVYTTDIVVSNLEFLENKNNSRNSNQDNNYQVMASDYNNDPQLSIDSDDLPF